MTRKLTLRQREVLAFIREQMAREGFPPTVREVAARFGIVSLNAVRRHLAALEAKGFLRREPGRSRGLRLLPPMAGGGGELVEVPLVGRIAAGLPVPAWEEVEETVPLDPDWWGAGREVFLLRVKGNSMLPCLEEGDLVVVDASGTPAPGDLVVALIEGEATVKRLEHRRGRPWLVPENPAYPALAVPAETRFNGRVVGLLRRYDGGV